MKLKKEEFDKQREHDMKMAKIQEQAAKSKAIYNTVENQKKDQTFAKEKKKYEKEKE